MSSNFVFLQPEWPELYEACRRAERLVYADARASCFYGRRALELAVSWLFRHDQALRVPYQDHLSALIHEPSFRDTVGAAVFNKARVIKDLGNLAVHSTKPVRQLDALTSLRELFHIGFWLARTYARGGKPADGLQFDANLVPKPTTTPPQNQAQLQALAAQIAERDTRLTDLLAGRTRARRRIGATSRRDRPHQGRQHGHA